MKIPIWVIAIKVIMIILRIEALGKYFGKEKSAQEMLRLYREKVSDHVPIKMTVDLK